MYRKGVCALIKNAKNEILLVNLTTFEKQFYAVPGGGTEKDELPESAIYREVEEELGINKNYLELLSVSNTPLRFDFKSGPRIRDGVEYIGQERIYFAFNFHGTDESITLNEAEVRNYIWSKYTELDQYLLFDRQLQDTQNLIKELFAGIFID